MDQDKLWNVEETAATWIRYVLWSATRPREDSSRRRTLSEFREQDAESDRHGFGACEAVDDMVRREPESAWLLILRLVELSPDDGVLASVAAGPLEDLLGLHPYVFIDRVEQLARSRRQFRRCLSGVWGWSSIPEDVQVRMRRTWEGEEPL